MAPRAWSRAELKKRWSTRTLQRALDVGGVVRVAPGVYLGAQCANDIDARIAAAATWTGRTGTLTGLAGLRLWGYAGRAPTAVDVQVPRAVRLAPPSWIRVRRSDVRQPAMVLGGIRVALVEYAALRAWCEAEPHERAGLLLDVMREKRLDAQILTPAAERLPRIPERRRLMRLLAHAAEGVTSYLEYVARARVFSGPQWSEMEWQAPVRAGGRRYRVDMLHRGARVAVEFDGARFHSDDTRRRYDIDRDAALAAMGYVTIRLTYEDVMNRPRWCRETVRRAIAARLHA